MQKKKYNVKTLSKGLSGENIDKEMIIISITYISIPKKKYSTPEINIIDVSDNKDIKEVAFEITKATMCPCCQENKHIEGFPKPKVCPFLELESCNKYEDILHNIISNVAKGDAAA